MRTFLMPLRFVLIQKLTKLRHGPGYDMINFGVYPSTQNFCAAALMHFAAVLLFLIDLS